MTTTTTIAILVAVATAGACGNGDSSGRHSAKATEAELQLHAIGNSAKKAFVRDNAFPQGTVALTPATPCCKQRDQKCAPQAADWSDPTWGALRFELGQPFRFQYSYTGTATSFTATAVGDPDCDGHPMTWTATGTVTAGEPTFVVSNVP